MLKKTNLKKENITSLNLKFTPNKNNKVKVSGTITVKENIATEQIYEIKNEK